jgi:predicted alpha/beta hydrolase
MTSQRIEVVTSDGARLAARLYGNSGDPVLLAGGLGIPQTYYSRFAIWLSQRGYQVLTFDLRGMYESRAKTGPQSIRNVQTDFLVWARQDFSACVHRLLEVTGKDQLTLFGHSLGMQHVLWADEPTQSRIKACIAITSGTGHWKDWAPRSMRMAPILFYVFIPVLTRLFGYFPGARLGMVGDLPKGVAMQWMRWCCHPQFAIGAEGPSLQSHCLAVKSPIQAYAFTDDEAISEKSVRQQLELTSNASRNLQILRPMAFGMRGIGHVGAFGRHATEALWTELTKTLQGDSDAATDLH